MKLMVSLFAFLLAIVPLVSATASDSTLVTLTSTSTPPGKPSIIPHPKDPCMPDSRRCNGAQVEICNNQNLWIQVTCPRDLVCQTEQAICMAPSPTSPSQDRCQASFKRCHNNNVEYCAREKWLVDYECGEGATCILNDKEPMCAASAGNAFKATATVSALQSVPPPMHSESCTVGDRKCDSNAYSLRVCNADRVWELEKKCTTPGDCKTDGPGKAHCERGGFNPPKTVKTRDDPQACTPKSRACDSERRFMFECDELGHWKEPLQCFGPGFCREEQYGSGSSLSCGGWPKFGGDKPRCQARCESLLYLQCGAADRKFKKCQDQMCILNDCIDCDRCQYKMPAGGVVPDPSTLVPAKRNDV